MHRPISIPVAETQGQRHEEAPRVQDLPERGPSPSQAQRIEQMCSEMADLSEQAMENSKFGHLFAHGVCVCGVCVCVCVSGVCVCVCSVV